MSERQIDIEAKLIALLELSKSEAAGTENEAKLALETAIRLASKHGISLKSITAKRESYAGDWFKGSSTAATVVEYTDERFAVANLKRWCDLVESFGWERHRRMIDDKEGLILMYRKEGQSPKLEVRIFERPWKEIEFEVLRNPDPILGKLEEWMDHIFDVVNLGVTFHDFREWLESERDGAPVNLVW